MHAARSKPDDDWLDDNWELDYCNFDAPCAERFLLYEGGKPIGFTLEFVLLYVYAFGPPCWFYSFGERARSHYEEDGDWNTNFSDASPCHFKYANARVDKLNQGSR
jgi:hypothetical protein